MDNELIAQRYKPLFTRARGGFADVIVAWDTKLTRRVAVKRISSGTTLPVASLEEARTLALLSSPNIVSVYDFEQTGTETLMIMENVDGPSLAELMANSQELLDLDVITTILDGIVAALSYAHENQVLHLDIKPANILIDQSGHIKVSDFGLAELAGSGGFGEVQGGTIGYMPPEQLSGGMIDVRTDIWALAALSYQLLTGVNPFFALSPRESLQYIANGSYALPSGLRPGLDGSIDETLVKALSAIIEVRPATVSEFWLALRPHLGRIGPGRRRLKSLARAWAGKEAAEHDEGAAASPGEPAATLLADDDDEAAWLAGAEDTTEETSRQQVSVWNGNYEDEAEDERREQAALRKQQRAQERANKKRKRAAKKSKLPLWQRLGQGSQTFIARVFCALAMASMAWLAMSALPYLSDPLAQAATAAAVSTGSATPALLDAAFFARMAVMLVVALVGFAVPSIGGALAAICLVLGLFFSGNWLIGLLILAACVAWWIFVGRHSPVDAALFPLSSLLALVSLPMALPLLSGYFLNWRHALATTALSCVVCSLLSILTYGMADAFFANILGGGEAAVYGQFSSVPIEDLLSVSPTLMQMPNTGELFIPLISLFTTAEFWLVLVSWLLATVVMSILIGGKSRVKYMVATLCGAGIVGAGYLLPLLAAGWDNGALLLAIAIRLIVALAICLLLIALGVQAKPAKKGSRGR